MGFAAFHCQLVLICHCNMHAGVMLASFVGVVATTLVFASFGLVAISSSVATGAAAGKFTIAMK